MRSLAPSSYKKGKPIRSSSPSPQGFVTSDRGGRKFRPSTCNECLRRSAHRHGHRRPALLHWASKRIPGGQPQRSEPETQFGAPTSAARTAESDVACAHGENRFESPMSLPSLGTLQSPRSPYACICIQIRFRARPTNVSRRTESAKERAEREHAKMRSWEYCLYPAVHTDSRRNRVARKNGQLCEVMVS